MASERSYNPLMARELESERCLACERDTPPLPREEALVLLRQTRSKWHLSEDGRALTRQITFKTFDRALAFLDRLADIAERDGHHPDFCLSRWNPVSLSLTTHAIGGPSRNDFVLAARLQAAIRPPSET